MEHGPRLSIAIVRPLPTVAGNVAALALTTPPGEKVYLLCLVKSNCQSLSFGSRAIRSRLVAAILSLATRSGLVVTSMAKATEAITATTRKERIVNAMKKIFQLNDFFFCCGGYSFDESFSSAATLSFGDSLSDG